VAGPRRPVRPPPSPALESSPAAERDHQQDHTWDQCRGRQARKDTAHRVRWTSRNVIGRPVIFRDGRVHWSPPSSTDHPRPWLETAAARYRLV